MPGDDPTNTVLLPMAALKAMAAELPLTEERQFWQWATSHPSWRGGLRPLVEHTAAALMGRCAGEAVEQVAFAQGVALLRWCEDQGAPHEVLQQQLLQVVGRLHQWLVMEEAQGPTRSDWFWCGYELVQWLEALAPGSWPDWWAPVKEQLVRLGALAWMEKAQSLGVSSDAGKQSITRALTLLQALRPLHDPMPEWIAQALEELNQPITAVAAPVPEARSHPVNSSERDGVWQAMQASGMGPPVTLTAISGRLATLPAVVESLRQQTYRPARINLYLSQEPHLLDKGISPDHPLLREITTSNWVKVHWVPNLGPYRKIIPFLHASNFNANTDSAGDNDLFITIDDDTIYPPRFIEYLMRNYVRYGCVVAHRGRRIRLTEARNGIAPFRPYAEWHDGVREPRLANLPTGQSGVLYRRSWFPQDLELEAALALAPTHDDLWLRWLTARQGVQAVILQPNAAAKTNELAFPAASPAPIAEKQTLWHAYNGPAGGNDDAVVAVQAYWQARGFDLAALLADEQEQQADFY